jgi:hypothetical protein
VIGTSGQSATVAMSLALDPGALGAVPAPTMSGLPVLNVSNVAGGPTSGRSMKIGFDLVNTTGSNNIGGVVYILAAKSRLNLEAQPAVMTNTQWINTMNAIIAHPDTGVYAAADFVRAKHFYSWPVDDTVYHAYNPWLGTETQNTYLSHAAVWPSATTNPRPMAYYWVVFDKAANINSFTLSVRGTFYTRWPLGTVGSLVQSDVKTVPQALLNASEASAARTGPMGVEITASGGLSLAKTAAVGLASGSALRVAGQTARYWRDRNGFW